MFPSSEGQNSNAFKCFSPESFFYFFLWKSRETNLPLVTWLPVQSLSVVFVACSHARTDPITLHILKSTPSAGLQNAPGDSAEASGPASLVSCTFDIHYRLYFHLGMDFRYSVKLLKCIFYLSSIHSRLSPSCRYLCTPTSVSWPVYLYICPLNP